MPFFYLGMGMKKILFLVLTLLTSCAQLMNGQEQPVVAYRDGQTYKTTCSGPAGDWGSCYRKAKRTCPNGYEVEEHKSDTRGVDRLIIFRCNSK